MTRVFVGMSGGVDSSLTAALLVEQGYDVTGVYMKNWTQDLPGMRCPWADDLADAKRVAVQLGISFRVYDFQKQYKEYVVDYMVAQYQAGRTPNPDIMCNQEVKFQLFLKTALDDGADMIATGHYARVDDGHLMMAADTLKDQTYFLYRVSHRALQKTLFPLGEYKKSQVRELALQRKLTTAAKPDSQGICFVGSVGIKDFLSQYVVAESGDIIDRESNKTVGRHDGAIYYTLGQRHGLDLGGGLPYYVVGKDMDANVVYVSRNLNDATMFRDRIELSDVHWIDTPPHTDADLLVRMRHRGELLPCKLVGDVLMMQKPERAVAKGQSAVIYSGSAVLGGGFIS